MRGGSLGRLWRGELPLADAFWSWAVLGGLAVNLATSLIFAALVMQGRPVAGLLLGHGLSLPYNIFATVGVWRAAARYDGAPHWAQAARVVALAAGIVLSIL